MLFLIINFFFKKIGKLKKTKEFFGKIRSLCLAAFPYI